MSEPFRKQVGGDHYKGFAIEPIRFCQKNGLGAAESSIVKYACRWKRKHTGNLDDLRKIIHYAELLIAMELESPDAAAKKTNLEAHENSRRSAMKEIL